MHDHKGTNILLLKLNHLSDCISPLFHSYFHVSNVLHNYFLPVFAVPDIDIVSKYHSNSSAAGTKYLPDLFSNFCAKLNKSRKKTVVKGKIQNNYDHINM